MSDTASVRGGEDTNFCCEGFQNGNLDDISGSQGDECKNDSLLVRCILMTTAVSTSETSVWL